MRIMLDSQEHGYSIHSNAWGRTPLKVSKTPAHPDAPSIRDRPVSEGLFSTGEIISSASAPITV